MRYFLPEGDPIEPYHQVHRPDLVHPQPNYLQVLPEAEPKDHGYFGVVPVPEPIEHDFIEVLPDPDTIESVNLDGLPDLKPNLDNLKALPVLKKCQGCE